MKSLGIVRKLDKLGRISLPIELRKEFNMKENDPLEIFTEGRQIILRKYEPGCQFCGSLNDIEYIDNIHICKECAKKIAAIL